jgi:hypothetical protein
MPNLCNNTIEITGPRDKIKALFDRAHQQDTALLNAMVPMPDNIFLGSMGDAERKMCEEQGIPNWYDWCYENWGTKWDSQDQMLDYTEAGNTATISGSFLTAWCPPIEALAIYGEQNPDVSITLDYLEVGMCFVGQYVIEDGSGIDHCVDYTEATSKTVRDIIGAKLDDIWELSEWMADNEDDEDDEEDEEDDEDELADA